MVVFSVGVSFASCTGFLDENPTTSLSESTVYNTEASLEAHIMGIYRGFCSSSGHMGNINEFLMTASGLIRWKSDRLASQNWTAGLKFTESANSSNAKPFYSEHYTNLNRCNRLLDNLPGSPVDPAYKQEIEAEARMLRALNLYYLVRLYGDVPMPLVAPRDVSDCSQPRVPFWKVYEQILKDLEFAEKYMRDATRVLDVTGTAASRPNKMAATALKGHVYMTIGSLLSSPDDNFWDTSKRTPDFSECGINSARDAWQLCYDSNKTVIESGVYELAPTFSQLFRWKEPEDFLLKERIITFCSSDQITYASLSTRTLPPYPYGTRNTTTVNNNSCRWRPDRFAFQKWCEVYGGAKGTGENNANIYVSCLDPRLGVSLMYNSYKSQQDGTVKSNTVYPGNSAVFNTGAYSTALYKKYLDPNFDVTSGSCCLYVLRYAEVFLNMAEACVELSSAPGDQKWNEAFDYIEPLHARARACVDSAEQPVWTLDRFTTKEDFIEALFWERFFELGGEEHEYFDTHRRGATFLVNTVAKPKNIFLKLPEQADYVKSSTGENSKGYWSYYYGIGYQYPEDVQTVRKSLLLPIPTEEIAYNKAIDPIKDKNDFGWDW